MKGGLCLHLERQWLGFDLRGRKAQSHEQMDRPRNGVSVRLLLMRDISPWPTEHHADDFGRGLTDREKPRLKRN